jgi:hypothetical protein
MRKNYLVQPDYLAERKADYETAEYLRGAFEVVSTNNLAGTCGNLASSMMVNKRTKKLETVERKAFEDTPTHSALYEATPSCLFLYRLICIFQSPRIQIDGADGYKSVWEMAIKHRATGEIFGLGEHKAAVSFWSKHYQEKDVPKKAMKDFLKLMNLILSDKSPHPYDGVTAGSVA